MRIKHSVYYHSSGNVEYEKWHKEGDEYYWHRENGPAFIMYYESGEKKYESWWVNDIQHKIDGPACITYYKDGTIYEEYWINNTKLTKKEWEEYAIKEAIKEALG